MLSPLSRCGIVNEGKVNGNWVESGADWKPVKRLPNDCLKHHCVSYPLLKLWVSSWFIGQGGLVKRYMSWSIKTKLPQKGRERVIRAIKPQGPFRRLARGVLLLEHICLYLYSIYLTLLGLYTSLENILLVFEFVGITIPVPEYDRMLHKRCALVHTLYVTWTPAPPNFLVPTLSVVVTYPLWVFDSTYIFSLPHVIPSDIHSNPA